VHIDLMHFIMGDVLGVADADLWASAFIAAFVLSVVVLFFRHFQLTSFDPVMAASIGMPVALIDYALTTCVSLVVVGAVSMVGVILVVGLLITPAASAYLLSDRLDRMMALSALFGVTSVTGGLYLCVWLDSSGGGAIMLFCTFQFLAVMALAPRYGLLARWIKLRRMVPQQLLEDILGAVSRAGSATASEIARSIPGGGDISRAVQSLANMGYLENTATGLALTEAGRAEASRIIRSHRLWETYLHHVGTPDVEIHPKAHELEHMDDPSAMEYIDDLLGHPVEDPHGKEIPEDPACAAPGAEPSLSRLRAGRKVAVVVAPATGDGAALEKGEIVTVEGRRDGGGTWVVKKRDGTLLLLDHAQADATRVRCV
jgi:manganese/iron transport system permease protein/iron/zinc/copper transport system permease protein